jgi:hypothetical protein
VEKFEEMNEYIGAKKRKRPKAFPAQEKMKKENEKQRKQNSKKPRIQNKRRIMNIPNKPNTK